jgi:hypothetical protein
LKPVQVPVSLTEDVKPKRVTKKQTEQRWCW